MNNKESAIAVAEKLGEYIAIDCVTGDICIHNTETMLWMTLDKYLQDKAAEILFSEGMVGKINGCLWEALSTKDNDYNDVTEAIEDWWACTDNNGTFDHIKFLNVWLELPDDE